MTKWMVHAKECLVWAGSPEVGISIDQKAAAKAEGCGMLARAVMALL
jgi:hypothetical protein